MTGGFLACAVCVAGLGAALPWYFVTAVVLSVLPFAFVGGVGFWLHRRAKAASDTAADDRAPGADRSLPD